MTRPFRSLVDLRAVALLGPLLALAVLAGGGGATSHAALLARSLDLPLVVGLGLATAVVTVDVLFTVEVYPGWTLLSLPIAPVARATVSELFAAAQVAALAIAYVVFGVMDVLSLY